MVRALIISFSYVYMLDLTTQEVSQHVSEFDMFKCFFALNIIRA